MNEIAIVRALLMRAYPEANSTLEGPTKGDHWLLEVLHHEIAIVVVWRDGGAFTVAVEHERDHEHAPAERQATVEDVVRYAVDRVSMFTVSETKTGERSKERAR